jgi:hypothetical protein
MAASRTSSRKTRRTATSSATAGTASKRSPETALASLLDHERVAQILADAFVLGDQATADRWGLTVRTLQRYRAAAEDDEQLGALVSERARAGASDWRRQRLTFLTRAIRRVSELAEQAGVEQLPAIVQAIKVVGELEITSKALRAPRPQQGEGAPAPGAGAGSGGPPGGVVPAVDRASAGLQPPSAS